MFDYKGQLLLVFALLPLLSYACVTLEDGRDGYLNCSSTNVASHISFDLISNGISRTITTCSISGQCQNFMPSLFQSEFFTSGTRRINQLHILRISKSQRRFRCRIDTRIAGMCNVDVFVSPAKPFCATAFANQTTSEVSVYCRTETVYPAALCVFYHRGDSSRSVLRGPIRYSHSDSVVSPGNRATECTIVLPLSSLTRTAYNFKVAMRALVVDSRSAHITESDYTCPFYPDPTDEPPNATDECQALSDTCATPAPTTFGTRICAAVEIGSTAFVNCGTTIANLNSYIGINLWQDGGFASVTSCTPQGACQTIIPDSYIAQFNTVGKRVQSRVRINSLVRDQTIFQCAIDNRIGGVCEFQAYRRPATPTCDPPTMTSDNTQVSITCHTAQVYPMARCRFFYIEGFSERIVKGEIIYTDTQSTVDPCDRATECTVLIPALSLPVSATIRFAVIMSADVDDNTTVSVPSVLSAPFVVIQ